MNICSKSPIPSSTDPLPDVLSVDVRGPGSSSIGRASTQGGRQSFAADRFVRSGLVPRPIQLDVTR